MGAKSPSCHDNRLKTVKTLRRTTFSIATALVLAMATPAFAQSMTGMAGVSDNGKRMAQIDLRMGQLEDTVRTLTGRVEEQDYAISRLRDQLKSTNEELAAMKAKVAAAGIGAEADAAGAAGAAKASAGSAYDGSHALMDADTAQRIQAQPLGGGQDGDMDTGDVVSPAQSAVLTGGGSVANHGTLTAGDLASPDSGDADVASAQTTSKAAQTLPEGNASQAYDDAFTMLKNKNYDGAQAAFQAFLNAYPDHVLAPNAMYWLGETYYVRNQYKQAARVFAQAYQKYPKGPKGPDNLLKLGLSLSGMGDQKNACVTLQQIGREYPHGANPVLARAQQEIKTLGCQ